MYRKKIIISFIFCILFVFSTFANTEIAMNLYAMPIVNFFNLRYAAPEDTQTKLNWTIGRALGIGYDHEVSYFIGSPTSFLDLGINTGFALGGSFGGKETKDGEAKNFSTGDFSLSFMVGSIARFNLGVRHSFVIASDLRTQLRFDTGGDDAPFKTETAWDLAVDLDLGYRFWFVNRQDYSFGLSVGANLACPLVGVLTRVEEASNTEKSTNYNYNGFETKIYLGIVFNTGTRSSQKKE